MLTTGLTIVGVRNRGITCYYLIYVNNWFNKNIFMLLITVLCRERQLKKEQETKERMEKKAKEELEKKEKREKKEAERRAREEERKKKEEERKKAELEKEQAREEKVCLF